MYTNLTIIIYKDIDNQTCRCYDKIEFGYLNLRLMVSNVKPNEL